jgi:hypothetical protein
MSTQLCINVCPIINRYVAEYFNVLMLPVTENFAARLIYPTVQIKRKLCVKMTKESCPLYLNILNKMFDNSTKQMQQFCSTLLYVHQKKINVG